MDLTRLAYLDFVLDWVRNNPDQHDNKTWLTKLAPRGMFTDMAEPMPGGSWWSLPGEAGSALAGCGTTGCLAGWGVQLSPQIQDGRWSLKWVMKDSYGDHDLIDVAYVDTTHDPAIHLCAVPITSAARPLFGLTYAEAEMMFSAKNSVPDLFALRNRMVMRSDHAS